MLKVQQELKAKKKTKDTKEQASIAAEKIKEAEKKGKNEAKHGDEKQQLKTASKKQG